MKLEQLKETSVDPLTWLREHSFQKFDDYTVSTSADGIIFRDHLNLKDVHGELKVKFKEVNGTFGVHSSSVTSLKNFPEVIDGNCMVINQQLTSLEHCPKFINGFFNVSGNKLTKIDYFPEHVGGIINLYNNKITTLKGIHKKITKLEKILLLEDNPIKESILGLLLIKGLTYKNVRWGINMSAELYEALDIMKPYYGLGRTDVMECQEKMIDAGLDEFADL